MKLCMIGDSHLAMFLEANKEHFASSLDLAPVTWPRQHLDQFSYEGAELNANGPELTAFWSKCGQPQRIDLTSFDKIVFVSHTVTMFNIFNILKDYVVSNWNGAAKIISALNDPTGTRPQRHLLSAMAFQECIAGIIKANHAYKIATQVRKVCDVPISVVPQPFLARNTLKHRPQLTGLKRILNHDDGAFLAHSYNSAHAAAFAEMNNVDIVEQPEASVSHGCLTKERYRTGAKRFGLDVEHKSDDVMHAGPLLGKLLLDQIL